jgi:lambda family phage tail tape measure protein
MATRMLIVAPILQFIKGLLTPGLGPLQGVNALKTTIPGFALSANGNVFAQNGIQRFARGGVVNQPTVFPFANGVGLMGEAGPEAIMPLKRGRDGKLGVSGGGGTVVNVSVDASGSKVEGNAGQGQQLGRAIAAAVQAELIKQKRPGGLLTL